MAGISRRQFSAQFKAETVQLGIQSDRMITQVAGELGINTGTLSDWVLKYRREDPGLEKKLIPADYGRLALLEEDNRRLRMENEFLRRSRPSSPGEQD